MSTGAQPATAEATSAAERLAARGIDMDAAWAREQERRVAAGLPPTVEDPGVLERLGRLFAPHADETTNPEAGKASGQRARK